MAISRFVATLGVALVMTVGSGASAALIGVSAGLGPPIIGWDVTGTLSYDAGTDLFSASGLSFLSTAPVPDDEMVSMALSVSAAGSIAGAGTLTVGAGGSYLAATVTSFGWEDTGSSSSTDFYDFLLTADSGSLVDDGTYTAGQTLGMIIVSESSNFEGGFDVNFGGQVKATLGTQPGSNVVPEPSAALMTAVALVLVQMRARRRS